MTTRAGTDLRPTRWLIGGLVALGIGIWAVAATARTDRLDTAGLDILAGSPQSGSGPMEDHLAWALEILQGAPFTEVEFEERFSPGFRSLLPYPAFQAELAAMAVDDVSPVELRGFAAWEPDRVAVAVVRDRTGDDFAVQAAGTTTEPVQLSGLAVVPIDWDGGPLSATTLAAHLAAAVALGGAGLASAAFGRPTPSRLLVIAAWLWIGQLLEIADTPLLYTAGLTSSHLGATVVGAALVVGGRPRRLRALDVAGIAAVVVAGVASAGPLTAIDTEALGLPANLWAPTHDRDRAEAFATAARWLVAAGAMATAAVLLVRQLAADRSETKGLVPVTFGGLAASMLVASLALSPTEPGAYDLSLSPIVSLAAILAAAGLAGTAFWDHFDREEVARELAVENEQLHDEIQAQLAEVRASRARIVEAAEAARRQVERDLHDGAQQRLLAVLLALRLGRDRFGGPDAPELDAFLGDVTRDLGEATAELRELSRGLRPAILDHGVGPAAESLAEGLPLPVTVRADAERCEPAAEHAAYLAIAEALTNAARHAEATHVEVAITTDAGELLVRVVDDGVGGARTVGDGAGLTNIEDRVAALGGTVTIDSPVGGGTTIEVTVPCGS